MTLVVVLRTMDVARTIDPVQGNQAAHARRWLDHAEEHLRTASSLAESDPAMALEAVHQACRKSLVAHMAAAGWRPAGTSKHALMVEYGRAALAHAFTEAELDGLDIIRRLRNIADYDDPTPPSVETTPSVDRFRNADPRRVRDQFADYSDQTQLGTFGCCATTNVHDGTNGAHP